MKGCLPFLVSLLYVAPLEPVPLRPIHSPYTSPEADNQEDQPHHCHQQEQQKPDVNVMSPFLFIKCLPPLSDEVLSRQPVLPRRTRSTPEYTLVLDLVSQFGMHE